jgi:FkbM family methyltransferase
MTKTYGAVYTVCIQERKEFKFSDGEISTAWTHPTDLWPNKIRSQVFDDIKSDCPVIVQIGANDGVNGEYYGLLPFLESLTDFRLFLIEPQTKYIKYLKEIYGKFSDKVQYLNIAITEFSSKFSMTDRENCAQIVSQNTNHFLEDGKSRLEVDGLSWSDFLKTYNINEIDILLMDCEGYEFNIIKQFKNDQIIPKKIRYEYPHFNNQDEVDLYLKEMGYSIEYCLTDPCWDKVAIIDGEQVTYNISNQWVIPKSVL